MSYFFSPDKNAFYDSELKSAYDATNSWPEDAIEVSDDIFQTYIAAPPEGKVRGSIEGEPGWVDVPPLTSEENVTAAANKKSILISDASAIIAPLQDAVDLDMATDSEKESLAVWKKYRVLLNRVDTSSAPEIDWPTLPS
ncbi:tail fiber assembly protein [Mixta hanseatica]|uniref:Tail fiber assembly protein n=1 Tax=Mixta hanseatica TaxID=2872648 RepID=A0ABY4RB69_9GAMM|nr:tail fiber assembly protein [Mixta hanseatica]UQY45080.1 tail fiber assembly protein [Mixta hanseatica]